VITNISPAQAKPGDSITLTVTGTGLATINHVSFTTSGGQAAGTITVTSVTPQSGSGGTVVTASVALGTTTPVGGLIGDRACRKALDWAGIPAPRGATRVNSNSRSGESCHRALL
jgi:hypothetical protein